MPTSPAGNGGDSSALFNTSNPNGTNATCTPAPTNFEVPGNNCDDDGNGKVDDVLDCDQALPVEGPAEHFARALGICQMADQNHWGLVSATYSGSYGVQTPPNPAQHGILPRFGASLKPRQGASLGVLSTGYAREFNGSASGAFQQGASMTGPGQAPPGYPQPSAGCETNSAVNDVATLKLTLRTPTNAKGLSFDFNFLSGEWPQWVCTRYNDGFVAMLATRATNGGQPVNISFDAQHNPVSVNNGYFDRCTPNTLTGCNGDPPQLRMSICAGGEAELSGTGFEVRNVYCGTSPSTGGGATGWLTSQAPIMPNEQITLEFVIWDTGDQDFDSSVLLDNLRWQAGPTQVATARPK